MKVLPLLLFFFSFSFSLYSQPSIWGTVKNGGQYDYGYLYKTNATGDNRVVIHHFDSIHGKGPGPVIQASNGKLYGMTAQGGQGAIQISLERKLGGTLFEYDPVIDSFRILVHFNATDPLFPQFPTRIYGPSDLKLLEVSPGVLWAVLALKQNNNGVIEAVNEYIISYNIGTGVMANVTVVPTWTTPLMALPRHTSLSTELYKATDGYVYSTTRGYSSCATTTDASNGSVVRIDPATNTFSYIRPFPCSYLDGLFPQGNFTEVNGKLYASTTYGGPNITIPTFMGYGLIYEYNPAANTYTRKYDFLGTANGGNPMGYQLKAANGKLYGATARGSVNTNFPNGSGTIYEYDVATNTHTKKADFSSFGLNTNFGSLWLSASNGYLYGTSRYGIFEYNTATNQIRTAATLTTFYDNAQPNPIIEVCQKPIYHYQTPVSYTICSGSLFHYNLYSTNTQTYVWKQNGAIVPSQTTGILHFNSITAAQTGTWTCEMTNGCGTTVSPAFTITVLPSVMGITTSTIQALGSSSICPGSSITLTGNTNGTWNTGSTAPSIVVSNPGTYQVRNTNACGSTFSNIITIDTIPTPLQSVVSFTNTNGMQILGKYICPGDSALASGNLNGTWNTGETTPSIYIKDNLPHYVVNANTCSSVNSATLQALFIVPPASPTITASGPLIICAGDSVLLDANGTDNYNWYKANGTFDAFISNGNRIYVKNSGTYFIKIGHGCGPVYSNSVNVQANGVALTSAIITPLGSTVICQGSGVVLQSNYASCVWSNGATTQTILATGAGPYTVTNYNSCSSVTSAPLSLSVIPAPTVSYTQVQDSVCLATAPFNLGPGFPTGGYYTIGTNTTTTFDPALLGSGTHTVSYHFQDVSTGCSATASRPVYVDYDPLITVAGQTVICQGTGVTVLFQQYTPYGTWNTGVTGQLLVVNQPGTYFVTKTNICGNSVNSNTVLIASKPTPTLSISPPQSICQGSQVTLTVGGASTYTWNPGGTTQSTVILSPATTTAYTVAGTGTNGCLAEITTTVIVDQPPALTVNSATICSGASATLTAIGANTYSWSTSQTTASVSVSPSASTIYSVTGTGTNLCSRTATALVTVHALPSVPVISQNGQFLQSSTAASYQWYVNGGPISGATSQTCAVTQNGNYTVVITDANGCSSQSVSFSVTDTGISAIIGDAGISVFPNPNAGVFTVRVPSGDLRIRISNTLGQLIYQQDTAGITEHRFELHENGIYMIEVVSETKTHTQKLMVCER